MLWASTLWRVCRGLLWKLTTGHNRHGWGTMFTWILGSIMSIVVCSLWAEIAHLVQEGVVDLLLVTELSNFVEFVDDK